MKLMLFKEFLILFVLIIACSSQAWASSKNTRAHLGAGEIERVKMFKETVKDIDDKTLDQTILELEKSPYPLLNLQIKEAMARAYADIIKEEQVNGLKKKQWLYSKIALSMAYMQFGGGDESAQGSELNRLILQKLKGYLPAGFTERKGFHYSLE